MASNAAEITLQVDPQRLAAFLRDEDSGLFRHLVIEGEKVKVEAQRLVGVYELPPAGPARKRRPGTLRDSIVKRVVREGGGFVVVVGSEDEVALIHHEGTVPHVIRAVNAPRLVFWSRREGRVVYRIAVNHPGTQPNRYLVDALAVLN